MYCFVNILAGLPSRYIIYYLLIKIRIRKVMQPQIDYRSGNTPQSFLKQEFS